MFFLVSTFRRFKTMPVLKENKRLLLFFLAASLLFALYMWLVEELSLLDTYYFLVTTATTVGYGDISPKTGLGKVFVTLYMVIGIALLGLFLGKVTELMVEVGSKRKKGLISMKGQVDLIIAGYPSDEKVQNIVTELRNDSRFEHAVIVCANNRLDEKPAWMASANVDFVKGVASDSGVLKKAGLDTAETVLILANDASLVESDDLSTSICAVVERIRPKVRTIIEKVRKDELLFQVVNADTIVDVASSSVLAQEILDQGAIELQNAIFSTHTEGTQYNVSYAGEDKPWSLIATAILKQDAIPEGFQNPGERWFNLLPKQADVVKQHALIKYRGVEVLEKLEP
ncbi:MAG: potassium channel family protein [Leucothrix sp.]